MRITGKIVLGALIGISFPASTQTVVDESRITDAKNHIHQRSGFFPFLKEELLWRNCQGYSEVYRLFRNSLHSPNRSIKIGSRDNLVILIVTTGPPGADFQTWERELPSTTMSEIRAIVDSANFLELDTWPGIWRPDADRFYFEWCKSDEYYAVDRQRDSEITNIIDYFESLAGLQK